MVWEHAPKHSSFLCPSVVALGGQGPWLQSGTLEACCWNCHSGSRVASEGQLQTFITAFEESNLAMMVGKFEVSDVKFWLLAVCNPCFPRSWDQLLKSTDVTLTPVSLV